MENPFLYSPHCITHHPAMISHCPLEDKPPLKNVNPELSFTSKSPFYILNYDYYVTKCCHHFFHMYSSFAPNSSSIPESYIWSRTNFSQSPHLLTSLLLLQDAAILLRPPLLLVALSF